MNILMLLKPKSTVKFIFDTNTLRQGIEKMRVHGYTAIPVIDSEGKYIGTVSEGDFLYYLLDLQKNQLNEKEKDEVLRRAESQNFVPVVDDRGTFIGIVTRQDIIRYFINNP